MEITPNDRVEKSEAIYRERLKTKLEKEHLHDYVAIEPVSGDYFLGKTMRDAMRAARLAYPDRLMHVMRIGHSVAVEIGYSE